MSDRQAANTISVVYQKSGVGKLILFFAGSKVVCDIFVDCFEAVL